MVDIENLIRNASKGFDWVLARDYFTALGLAVLKTALEKKIGRTI